MGCLKGKNKTKPDKGKFKCKKCGACSKKQTDLCKPEEIKENNTNAPKKQKKKEKKKGSK